MWHLVIKDFYLQRRRLALVSILAAAAVGMMFFKTDFGLNGLYPALLVFVFTITYTYTLYSCFTEDRNKGMRFLRSLPLSARTIVNSKFVGVIVLEFIIMVIVYLVIYLGKLAGLLFVARHFSVDVGYVFWVGFTVLLLNSIVLFIYFRWGYNRMQMIYTISFFVVFFGGLSWKIMPEFTIFYVGVASNQAAVFGLLLALLLELLCWQGSVAALNRRNL